MPDCCTSSSLAPSLEPSVSLERLRSLSPSPVPRHYPNSLNQPLDRCHNMSQTFSEFKPMKQSWVMMSHGKLFGRSADGPCSATTCNNMKEGFHLCWHVHIACWNIKNYTLKKKNIFGQTCLASSLTGQTQHPASFCSAAVKMMVRPQSARCAWPWTFSWLLHSCSKREG